MTRLVSLFSMFMFYFSLKPIRTVHFFRFVITPIDVHKLGI